MILRLLQHPQIHIGQHLLDFRPLRLHHLPGARHCNHCFPSKLLLRRSSRIHKHHADLVVIRARNDGSVEIHGFAEGVDGLEVGREVEGPEGGDNDEFSALRDEGTEWFGVLWNCSKTYRISRHVM